MEDELSGEQMPQGGGAPPGAIPLNPENQGYPEVPSYDASTFRIRNNGDPFAGTPQDPSIEKSIEEELPNLTDVEENSWDYTEEIAPEPPRIPSTWRCVGVGDRSGELLWESQIAGLVNGLLLRQYTHVIIAGGENEWFAQCAMVDNQIPYVELGLRINDAYNQVLRFTPLRGTGMRALDVVKMMEDFFRAELYPAVGKFTEDVYYY